MSLFIELQACEFSVISITRLYKEFLNKFKILKQ
jgi:hypothetical protein